MAQTCQAMAEASNTLAGHPFLSHLVAYLESLYPGTTALATRALANGMSPNQLWQLLLSALTVFVPGSAPFVAIVEQMLNLFFPPTPVPPAPAPVPVPVVPPAPVPAAA